MEVNQDLATNTTAIAAAIGAIVFGAQRAIKAWSSDRGDIQKIGIDTDLYTRMSAELKRLADTNKSQEVEISILRERITHIFDEFTNFKIESAKRDAELNALRAKLNLNG